MSGGAGKAVGSALGAAGGVGKVLGPAVQLGFGASPLGVFGGALAGELYESMRRGNNRFSGGSTTGNIGSVQTNRNLRSGNRFNVPLQSPRQENRFGTPASIGPFTAPGVVSAPMASTTPIVSATPMTSSFMAPEPMISPFNAPQTMASPFAIPEPIASPAVTPIAAQAPMSFSSPVSTPVVPEPIISPITQGGGFQSNLGGNYQVLPRFNTFAPAPQLVPSTPSSYAGSGVAGIAREIAKQGRRGGRGGGGSRFG